ncbi:hypothetical protein BGZ82_003083 [Podila clonocystis]|nr:hypothetical protein BGZ82_003083 [Podila clonocystis]
MVLVAVMVSMDVGAVIGASKWLWMKGGVGWAIVLAIGIIVLVLFILDMIVVVAYMTAHSFIRSDSGIMYLIYGTLMIPVVLAGIPALSRARNFKAAAGIQFLLLVSIA